VWRYARGHLQALLRSMALVHSAMRGTGGCYPCNASSGAHCSVGAHAFSRVAYNATHALPRLRTRPPPAH
jgi:hypothetical protein